MQIRFRSIDVWPYESTPERKWGQFKSSVGSTVELVQREIEMIGGSEVTIECMMRPRDIRVDGWPKADARNPDHPGIALHFDTENLGHLRYGTDVFRRWEHNLRAIALGLQALRAVDRYGITRGGEQYRGFAALPSGIALGPASMSPQQAAEYIAFHAGYVDDEAWRLVRDDPSIRESAFRKAVLKLHPDKGGDAESFGMLQDARKALV